MGAADSIDDKPLADDPTDAAAEGDGSSYTVGAGSPGFERDDATGEGEGRKPIVTAVASGEATLDPSDSVGFILRADPPTAAESSSPGGDLGGAEAERNVTVPQPGDPSSLPTVLKP